MGNIYTNFVRVHAWPGHHVLASEAEWITWRLLGPFGSYYVPVWFQVAPDGSFVDVQLGRSHHIVDFCEELVGEAGYRAIWGRWFDEGGDRDEIWSEDVNDGPRRFCRYGFDEVRVTARNPPVAPEKWHRAEDGTWRLAVDGSYRTGNDRSYIDIGSRATPGMPLPETEEPILATPTTPNDSGRALTALEPQWLAPLADEELDVERIDYLWRGRVVHRGFWGPNREGEREWQDRAADDWDNCVDAGFLRFNGMPAFPVPAKAAHGDLADWTAARRC
ncbi:hypothetical protein AB0I28_12190 [Phytomonospora sp. NPDC050363]|uniref:hypothetical protein n=1 Tax=Phytomonospora sp. NPDC050363 TaxID=3155642 RepID=UPI0033CCB967